MFYLIFKEPHMLPCYIKPPPYTKQMRREAGHEHSGKIASGFVFAFWWGPLGMRVT